MHDRRAGLRPTVVAPLLLVAVWLVFVYPTFLGKARFPVDFSPAAHRGPGPAHLANPELGDAIYAEYPWHSYLGEQLRHGAIPLWDPHRFAGTPFASTATVAAWYPPNWLYATGRTLAVFTLISVFSLLGALLLWYWFLRLVRLHPYAAAVGALTATFSAFLIKWSAHDSILGSTMWLPLALAGVTLACRREPRRGICLGGVGLALSLLGGHPQMALYVWSATALWAVFLVGAGVVDGSGERGQRVVAAVRRVAAIAGMVVLAAGLSAVLLVPLARVSSLIVRSTTSYGLLRVTALGRRDLPTFLLPDYRGSALAGNFTRPILPFIEVSLYPGLLAMPLAAVALVRRWTSAVVLFFAALAIVGFLSTFNVLAFDRLFFSLPGFSRTRFPTRSIFFLDVGLAGLVAAGLDVLLTQRARLDVLIFAAISTAAALGVVWAVFVDRPPVSRSFLLPGAVWAVAVLVVGVVLVAALLRASRWSAAVAPAVVLLVAADLWLPGHRWHPFQDPAPIVPVVPEVAYLKSVPGPRPRFANAVAPWVFSNFALDHDLYTIEGYDPFIIGRMVNLVGLAQDQTVSAAGGNVMGQFGTDAFRSPIMDLLGVRTVVAPPGAPIAGAPTITGNVSVVDRPSAFPPAFVARCAVVASGTTDLAQVRAMSSADLRSTAVVAAPAFTGPLYASGSSCVPGPAGTVAVYDPQRVVVDTPDGPPGVLVLTDAWFPGWRVKVDGRRATLLRVDHALRGVLLPAGPHRVEFSYRPSEQIVGAVVTAGTLSFLLTLVILPTVSGRRRRRALRPGTA